MKIASKTAAVSTDFFACRNTANTSALTQGRKMCCSCLAFDAKQHHKYVVSKGPNMVWFLQPDNLEYFVQTYTI